MSFWQLYDFLGFNLWILLKEFRSKVTANFFAVLALSALRQLRDQSDLLDETAFKALPLVVSTKRPI